MVWETGFAPALPEFPQVLPPRNQIAILFRLALPVTFLVVSTYRTGSIRQAWPDFRQPTDSSLFVGF
jgi:hypothetical protein